MKRKRLENYDATYPTLNAFTGGRRSFLKRLTMGGMALGAGMLVACSSSPELPQEPDAISLDDTGNTTTTDTSRTLDAEVDQSIEDEMPWAGGMVEPEFYNVVLPQTGTSEAYLQLNDYLSFFVTFTSYDFSVVSFFEAENAAALQVIADVLSTSTCEAVADPAQLDTLEADLTSALASFYQAQAGYSASIEGLVLHVEYCEVLDPMMGDQAEPQYP